ncbi:hypothetical protein LLH00_17635 [bacterium]|nr:hypothetical protein [bacterium]
MVQSFLQFVRSVDWSGYHISVFEVLLVVFALLKRFNVLSLLILGIVLGRGFVEVQRNTDFAAGWAARTPFLVYTFCAAVFFIYALLKLFTREH